MNVDEEPGIASRYDVLSIPTVILFSGGEARGSVVGVRPRAHFEQWSHVYERSLLLVQDGLLRPLWQAAGT